MKLLGLDPGLQRTGWGVIQVAGNRLAYVASGTVKSRASDSLADRLAVLHQGLMEVLVRHEPASAAIEETFVNRNGASTLLLGQARGVALLAPARLGIRVAEYPANLVKKTVTGYGHAEKTQIARMVQVLLGGGPAEGDEADALAIAICHAFHEAAPRAVA